MTAGIALIDRIAAAAAEFPRRVAVWARDETITYAELVAEAQRIAAALLDAGVAPGDRVAVLSRRSCAAYAAIVGVLRAGCVYVPLGTQFPAARNRRMLELSGATALVIDGEARRRFAELLVDPPGALATIVASGEDATPLRDARLVQLDRRAIATARPRATWPHSAADADCYLIFTSGSTGEPKGVPISHANMHAYYHAMQAVVPVMPDDRVTQLGELTFDISISGLVMVLGVGATLYDIPEHANLLATRFVQEHELTFWFSVPSAIALAKQAGLLEPGSLPSLRASQIGGEALHGAVASAWIAAAPNSAVFNLYGPTEGTVVWSAHRIAAGLDDTAVVPIGKPLPGLRMELFGSDERPAPRGEAGELWISGPQLTRGYWNAPELDAARFRIVGGTRWYRTGDLARWTDADGFHYLGRVDQQTKILGFRVELLEIERALRAATARDEVAVIAWPLADGGGARGTVAFVQGPPVDGDAVLAKLRAQLPPYMIPARIIAFDVLTHNTSGKTDYRALRDHPALGA